VNVLVVKMSSMGDVIHCLPAVTDLLHAVPGTRVDWVVEEGFADIVRMHPDVHRVIPIAVRRWRGNWFKHRAEVAAFRRTLQATEYDVIVDAQGLIKSALVAALARGPVIGFARDSAREAVASLSYADTYSVPKTLHAIARQRRLFSGRFGYKLTPGFTYGLSGAPGPASGRIFFLHGTTWASKHWPEAYWIELATLCTANGYTVQLTHNNEAERSRAERIAEAVQNVEVVAAGSLSHLAKLLARAEGAVAVDTGLGHLAAAYNVPLVGLYGPTSPELTGVHGPRQLSLQQTGEQLDLTCAPCMNSHCRFKPGEHSSNIYPPCFAELSPARVFELLRGQMAKARR
jgi:heptosyltransferase-1